MLSVAEKPILVNFFALEELLTVSFFRALAGVVGSLGDSPRPVDSVSVSTHSAELIRLKQSPSASMRVCRRGGAVAGS